MFRRSYVKNFKPVHQNLIRKIKEKMEWQPSRLKMQEPYLHISILVKKPTT